MEYILLFFEGIITFISPCLLPMLPIYISYFAGGKEGQHKKTLLNAIGFVLGFTSIFLILGAFAGIAGRFLKEYQTIVNIVTGLIVIVFGLNFLGVFNLNIFKGMSSNSIKDKELGFVSSYVFGAIFSIGWSPCVGTFLSSALLLASMKGSTLVGMGMLLAYSLGLGIPFILSAIFIDRLKSTFDFIKKNYKVINMISGGLLVVMGILMMTGTMGYLLRILSV